MIIPSSAARARGASAPLAMLLLTGWDLDFSQLHNWYREASGMAAPNAGCAPGLRACAKAGRRRESAIARLGAPGACRRPWPA